jgi:aldose 1-epimerase
MSLIEISNDSLSATVSTLGGTLLRFNAHQHGKWLDILRPALVDEATPAMQSACFPLVPFGNRVSGNRFEHAGKRYRLTPNQSWDPHYVHGDGWLNTWTAAATQQDALTLVYEHAASPATPYSYRAQQRFVLSGNTMELTLSVTNLGVPLPFGLGWHPYFVLDPDTLLTAPATSHWLEGEHYLPTEQVSIPVELDFNEPHSLPRRWVNNGFAGWTHHAQIVWPSRALALTIDAGQADYYFLFVGDTDFDPSYRHDYFCFEPMTHAADSHSHPGLRGLVPLQAGDTTELSMRWTVSPADGVSS